MKPFTQLKHANKNCKNNKVLFNLCVGQLCSIENLATPTQAIQLALQIDYSKANYLSSLLTEL
jgi:hypothetical protein